MSKLIKIYEQNQFIKTQWNEWLNQFEDKHIYQEYSFLEASLSNKKKSYRVVLIDGRGTVLAMAQGILRLLPFHGAILTIRGGPVFRKTDLNLSHDNNLKDLISKVVKDFQVNYKFFYINTIFFSEKTGRSEIALQDSLMSKPTLERDPYLTFIVNIEDKIEDNIKKMDSKWRNQMRKSSCVNKEITFDCNYDSINKFIYLYREMSSIKDLKFNKNIQKNLINLHKNLGEYLKILIISVNERPVSGCVILLFKSKAYYYLAASSKQGRDGSFSNLMIVSLLEKLRAYHVDTLDLVGVDPKNNWGTFNFKRGVGGSPFSYLGEWEYASNAVLRLLINFFLYIKLKIFK